MTEESSGSSTLLKGTSTVLRLSRSSSLSPDSGARVFKPHGCRLVTSNTANLMFPFSASSRITPTAWRLPGSFRFKSSLGADIWTLTVVFCSMGKITDGCSLSWPTNVAAFTKSLTTQELVLFYTCPPSNPIKCKRKKEISKTAASFTRRVLIFLFERYTCSELSSNIKIQYEGVWLLGVWTLNRSYWTWKRTFLGARPDQGFFFLSYRPTRNTTISRDDVFISLEFFCYRKPEKLLRNPFGGPLLPLSQRFLFSWNSRGGELIRIYGF